MKRAHILVCLYYILIHCRKKWKKNCARHLSSLQPSQAVLWCYKYISMKRITLAIQTFPNRCPYCSWQFMCSELHLNKKYFQPDFRILSPKLFLITILVIFFYNLSDNSIILVIKCKWAALFLFVKAKPIHFLHIWKFGKVIQYMIGTCH